MHFLPLDALWISKLWMEKSKYHTRQSVDGQHISHIGTNSFAFITYDDTESALYAIKRMDGVKLGRYRVKGNRSATIHPFDMNVFY